MSLQFFRTYGTRVQEFQESDVINMMVFVILNIFNGSFL